MGRFLLLWAEINDSVQRSRIVDLDVDIGADAVDYKCVPLTTCTASRFFF